MAPKAKSPAKATPTRPGAKPAAKSAAPKAAPIKGLGPISPRTMLYVQVVLCSYFIALFAGAFNSLPTFPYCSVGNPFVTLGFGEENWALAYQAAGIVGYLLILTGAIALKGTDYDCVVACRAYAVNWFVCGLVFNYQWYFQGTALTENNGMTFVFALVYLYIGFIANGSAKRPSEGGNTLAAIGPLTSRRFLLVQLFFGLYFGLLFAGALTPLPSGPMMGGDPFEKFAFAPVNWILMNQIVGIIFYLHGLTAFIAFQGTDSMCYTACGAFFLTWTLCGGLWLYEYYYMGINFTEVNIMSFAVALVYAFFGCGPKKANSGGTAMV